MGEVITIDVENRQNKDVHLIEKAGHLRIAAIGGQSLRKFGKLSFSVFIYKSLFLNTC